MSPISAPKPCPYLIQDGTFYFCKIYDKRPEQCIKHGFSARFCPIGIEKLGLDTLDKIRQRIDDGWDKIELLAANSRE
jgi:Fe-S-cluster containining protein